MIRMIGNLLRLLMWGLAAAIAVLIAQYFLVDRLDEEIRAHIEREMAAHYSRSGLSVSLRSARRIPGEGIELRGLQISGRNAQGELKTLAEVDELLASGQTGLADLATLDPRIDQITVRRLKVHGHRHGDGSWDIASLLPLPQFGSEPPRVLVEDAQLRLTCAERPADRPLVLRDIQLVIEAVAGAESVAGGEPWFQYRGTVGGDYFERLVISGKVEPTSGAWQLRGTVDDIALATPLLDVLPVQVPDPWNVLSAVNVHAKLDFKASGEVGSPQLPQFSVSGRLFNGRVDERRLAYPLSDLHALVYCDNHGFRIDELAARSGPATFRLACSSRFEPGSPLTVRASARQLKLDQQLFSALPEPLNRIWDEYSPSGMVNLDLDLVAKDGRIQPDLVIECLDVSFAYREFPYRLQGGQGSIRLKDDVLRIDDFQALASGQVVHLRAEVKNPGDEATGWVTASADGPVPLDQKLLDALDDDARRVVSSLQPRGSVLLRHARFQRHSHEPLRDTKFVELDVVNCSMLYEHFPYPLTGIEGKLTMTDGQWEFRDLHGYNDSGYVSCDGSWTPHDGPGGALRMDFVAFDVPLEDELRDALTPDMRRVWNGLRPRGTIDHLMIGLRYDKTQPEPLSLDIQARKWPPDQNVEGRSLTVHPRWFPYRLDNVTGSVRLRDGAVELQELRASHGDANLAAHGRCELLPDAGWRVRFDGLTIDRLQLDHDLIAALPDGLAQAVTQLELRGPLNVRGPMPTEETDASPQPALELSGDGDTERLQQARWDVGLNLYDGSLQCGVKLDHIHGGMRMAGVLDQNGFRSHGQLDVDSMFYRDVQLTKVRGPVFIDESQVLFGRWRNPAAMRPATKPVQAATFGGSIAGDARVSLEDEGRFDLRATLTSGDLAEMSRELTARRQNITGRVFASVQLSGTRKGLHTLVGGGRVQLRDADIYQLPLMVALLKPLSLRPPDTTAFTTSDIDFRIEADDIYFDRIDFNGDAISLKGHGQATFQRQIDLRFYSLVGRQDLQFPVLKPLVGEASRQILEIQVVGTLDDPKINGTAFPGLNETLQQLFPEVSKSNSSQMPILTNARNALRGGTLLPKR